MKTLMADPRNRHYFGLNRPEQTGEAESHGFRTSAHADAAPALPTLDPTGMHMYRYAYVPERVIPRSDQVSGVFLTHTYHPRGSRRVATQSTHVYRRCVEFLAR